MRFTMSSGGGSPPGVFQAEFIRIESFDQNEAQYGPAVLLIWVVLDGQQKDVENSAVCSAKLSAKSKLGGFAQSLKGAPIAMDEEVDFEAFYGTRGQIVVEDSPSGNGTRVVSFIRAA